MKHPREEIIRLCHSGLDSRSLRIALLERLRAVVPFDYVYFSNTDPATYLSSSPVIDEEPPDWMMPVFVENEYIHDDFNKFSDMIRTRQTSAILSISTGGSLDLSQRYRDMLRPAAMEDELRVIFAVDGACWGTLCLHRSAKYLPEEAELLDVLSPRIAEGLRKAVLLERAAKLDAPDGPGVLILDGNLSIMALTGAAEFWLGELTAMERRDRQALPLAVLSVVARVRSGGQGGAKLRLRTASGEWLMVHASRLMTPSGEAQISVIFEVARPAEVVPIILKAYDLTRREGEVVQCVLQGWTTTEIAARLVITPNTVQDHLKAIFEKVDVGSRGELAARIFTRQFNP